MRTIHKLSQEQIAKIAAGEVIEKPSFAVKELIENSLDAKASQIQIFLEEGGLKKIQIIDDGIGMNEADLKECFKLHTTSKISGEDDLVAIRSMGFRGEALASIASISRMSIQSRQPSSSAGTQITLEEGKLVSSTPVGMPPGTQIEVFDLFYSVPGRKKFIENPAKEYRAILDWVIRIALANPAIRFSLTHNKKLVFDVPKNQTTLQRLQFFLKENLSLLPVEFEDTYVQISGFSSSVEHSTSSSTKQFVFVNNRPIIDRLINTAVKEAYGNVLESNKYPIYILSITIPFEMVDVNVHPRKEQVNFLNRQLIFDQIQKAIYQTIQINSPLHEIQKQKSITTSFAGKLLKQDVDLFGVAKKIDNDQKIAQFFELYLVFQAQNQLIMVDQHAAHERILYEQLKQEFNTKKTKKVKIASPQAINLSFAEKEILSQNILFFKELGFVFNKKLKLTAMPMILQDRSIEEIISELIEQIVQDKRITLDTKSEQLLKYLACRSAVKQGDKLTEQQSKDLIEKLFETPDHTHCPHGRPTFMATALSELNKQFKRFK